MTNNLNSVLSNTIFMAILKHFQAGINCYWLIYFEHFPYPMAAIVREKLKVAREKKNKLIEGMNPEWNFFKL